MELRGPIVILGFMACGKSEVARLVGQRLKVEVADLDVLITAQEGRSPATLIREEGERAFRTIESITLEVLLNSSSPVVIALGGGAWIESDNRKLLAEHDSISVWLDTPFDVCWERIQKSPEDRPLGTLREQAIDLYKLRRPIYELAQVHIEVNPHDSPDELAAMIEAQIAQMT